MATPKKQLEEIFFELDKRIKELNQIGHLEDFL